MTDKDPHPEDVSLSSDEDEEKNSTRESLSVKDKGANSGNHSDGTAPTLPSEQLSTLTSAIVELTKLMTEGKVHPSMRDTSTSNKGKRGAENLNNEDSPNPAKKVKQSSSSMSETTTKAGSSSMSRDSTDCEDMLKEVLESTASENNEKSSKESVEPEDEFLSELTKEYESEDSVGDKLENDQLSKLIDKMFRSKMAEKLLKEKMDRQERPENCANAKATRVNAGIWRRLREPTKKRDLHFFKMQQALVKGIIPVARIADEMMTAKSLDSEQIQSVKKMTLQALSLLTHVNYEINVQRRFLMKPDIGREYASLCSPLVPFTDYLFGDDLQKQLKDIGDENKIGAKIENANKQGYSPNSGSQSSRSGYNRTNNYYKSKNQSGRGRGHPGKKYQGKGNYQNPKSA